MKTKELRMPSIQLPKMTHNSRLDEEYSGKVLFPEKLAQAEKFLKKHGPPPPSLVSHE